MYDRILVPVDGSESSNQGLEEAIRIAKSQGSQLRLVHVVNEMIMGAVYGPGFYSGNIIEALQESGRRILEDAQALVRKKGLTCEAVMLESIGGAAAKFILDQANQWPADLIVMGTHGRRGLARITLGSDAEQVLREAQVPVLVIRSLPQRSAVPQDVKPPGARAA